MKSKGGDVLVSGLFFSVCTDVPGVGRGRFSAREGFCFCILFIYLFIMVRVYAE